MRTNGFIWDLQATKKKKEKKKKGGQCKRYSDRSTPSIDRNEGGKFL